MTNNTLPKLFQPARYVHAVFNSGADDMELK